MIDFIEIHNQLQEIREGKCTTFYGFNEIKNILLEQRSFSELEAKMKPLFKELSLEEKKEALPLLTTTTSAEINRYACYEMDDVIKNADSTLSMSVLKNLLDPYIDVPEDSYKALREQGFNFHLSMPIVDTIMANSNWDRLTFLIPELQKLSLEEKKEVSEKLEAVKPQATQNVQGIEIELFDCQTVLDALKA